MLTRILHNSPKLERFLDQLNIGFSMPQRQHILNLADALLTCEDTKTLAALQRQFLEAPDASNMAKPSAETNALTLTFVFSSMVVSHAMKEPAWTMSVSPLMS